MQVISGDSNPMATVITGQAAFLKELKFRKDVLADRVVDVEDYCNSLRQFGCKGSELYALELEQDLADVTRQRNESQKEFFKLQKKIKLRVQYLVLDF